jgi:hypothetical protein
MIIESEFLRSNISNRYLLLSNSRFSCFEYRVCCWQHISSNSGPRDFAKYRGLKKIFQLNSYATQVCSNSFLITGAYQVKIAMLNILRLRRSIGKYRDTRIEQEIVDLLKRLHCDLQHLAVNFRRFLLLMTRSSWKSSLGPKRAVQAF